MKSEFKSAVMRPVLTLSVLLASWIVSVNSFSHSVHETDSESTPSLHHAMEDTLTLLAHYRATGDDDYLDQAWLQVSDAKEGVSLSSSAMMAIALIAQARHEFDFSLRMAQQATKDRSTRDQAWLLLATINLVKGNLDAAQHACRQLGRAAWPLVVGCHARTAHAKNESMQVKARIETVINNFDRFDLDASHQAWLLSIAGDIQVAAGDTRAAIDSYQRSLRLQENVQVRVAFVDTLIADAKLAEAELALDEGSNALPLLLRRLMVDAADGHVIATAQRSAMDETFRRWIEAGDFLHAREMAMFYLHLVPDPELAHQLAVANLRVQREPEDIVLHKATREALGL